LDLERLGEIAQASRDGSAQSFCERLWAELTAYQGTSTQFDDVALVAIRGEA
jgi:serine phosphatase RsbU (regulator of sigma subunit)